MHPNVSVTGPRGTPLDLQAVEEGIKDAIEANAQVVADDPDWGAVGYLEDTATALLAHCRALRAALQDADVALRLLTIHRNAEMNTTWLEGRAAAVHAVEVTRERAAAVLAQGKDE